jgi:lactoylglutathione lyase
VTGRSFPIVYSADVARSARFYVEHLGFEETFRFPPGEEVGFINMKRGESELGVTERSWPAQMGIDVDATGARFEMFVYVDDVDAAVAAMRDAGVPILRDPEDMPWGERVAFVTDPDGNPIAVAAAVG